VECFEAVRESAVPGAFLLAGKREVDKEDRQRGRKRKRGSCTEPRQALTDSQLRNLKEYARRARAKWGRRRARRAYFHVNDNPAHRPVMTIGGLPTIRRAMGPIWSAEKRRVVTTRELFAAMGRCRCETCGK
jgi:hypothetical protein